MNSVFCILVKDSRALCELCDSYACAEAHLNGTPCYDVMRGMGVEFEIVERVVWSDTVINPVV